MEKFYLCDTVGAGKGAVDSVTTRIKGGWSKFRDLALFLASRGLPLRAKGGLCSGCVRNVMLYGKETCSVKVENVNRLERNDARMVRWMCNVWLEEMISSESGLVWSSRKN